MSGFKYVEDPILGKGRAEFIGGGTGGESYVAGDGIEINGNTISATGGGGEGTVTGIEASVDGGTATITATGSTTSVKLTGTGGVAVKGNTNTGAVELDAKDLSDGTQSVTKDVKQARFVEYVTYATAATQNALTLLHFSDIHADTAALARIVAAGDALGSLVNDMICTGDLVENYATGSISSWWNPKVMTVIGNHDSANSSYSWNGTSMANRDAYYIAPFESNWSVTHTSGTSYYYKDYSTQKVRLIVLDAMLYMSDSMATEAAAQTSWLEGLLASAITGSLHVVIALHAPKLFSPVVPCSFSKYGASIVDTTATECTISDTVINAVSAAKANGLKFVGYICGHTHQDYINDILGDGSQYAYCVTCAAVAQTRQWMPYSDMFRDSTLDAFNLVTIDTSHTTVAIIRGGGANIDEELRPRETISINYGTGEIVDREIPKIQNGFRSEFENGVGSVARYIGTETVTGTTVTLQAGHAYTANVNDTITLNVETPPTSASYGLDGLLDLNLSGGTVAAGENVYLADTLTANSRNICAVRFIDGIAVVNVLTVTAPPDLGYIVTVASGTTEGSLYYGLVTDENTVIRFDVSLDEQTINANGAVTNGEKHIIGNGAASTIITNGLSAVDRLTELSSMSLSGATPSFAMYTSGGLTYLNGVLFDSNSNGGYGLNGGEATVAGCTFSNNTPHYNYGNNGGGILAISVSSLLVSGCIFSGNSGGTGDVFTSMCNAVDFVDCTVTEGHGGTAELQIANCSSVQFTSCTVTENPASYPVLLFGGTTTVSFCVFSGNANNDLGLTGSGSGLLIDGNTIGKAVVNNGGQMYLANSNTIGKVSTTAGVVGVTISGGASVTLTSSINVGASRITVLDGGCVVNGATIAAGTYTQIVSSGGSAVAS